MADLQEAVEKAEAKVVRFEEGLRLAREDLVEKREALRVLDEEQQAVKTARVPGETLVAPIAGVQLAGTQPGDGKQ